MNKHIVEMPPVAKYDVFISYSREDYIVDKVNNPNPNPNSPVAQLMAFLDSRRVTYWIDKKGVFSGSQFSELIATAIDDSKMVIFVSSKASNMSQWTADEICYAKDQQKLIIPFRVDDCPYSKKYSVRLSTLDRIDFFVDHDAAFSSLYKSVLKGRDVYKRRIIEEEIRHKEEEYDKQTFCLNKISDEISGMMAELGNCSKKCPICGKDVPIADSLCGHCGWTFIPPLQGILRCGQQAVVPYEEFLEFMCR